MPTWHATELWWKPDSKRLCPVVFNSSLFLYCTNTYISDIIPKFMYVCWPCGSLKSTGNGKQRPNIRRGCFQHASPGEKQWLDFTSPRSPSHLEGYIKPSGCHSEASPNSAETDHLAPVCQPVSFEWPLLLKGIVCFIIHPFICSATDFNWASNRQSMQIVQINVKFFNVASVPMEDSNTGNIW